MKPRVYIDTSVAGGYFDEEFASDTKIFFDRIFRKDFLIYFSEISETELFLAPDHVKELKSKRPARLPDPGNTRRVHLRGRYSKRKDSCK